MTDESCEFPVDESTLGMLWLAIHPREVDPDAERSTLWDTLEMISMMAPDAEVREREFTREDGSLGTKLEPAAYYTEHSVIAALITEVRRLRADALAGYQGAVALLRDPQTLRHVSTDEECECGHAKLDHPKEGACVSGVTWTTATTCPCMAYTPVLVANDPFGFAEKYLRRAAEYLEIQGRSDD